MSETRKLAAILCSDVVGYSRLAGADEDRILARLRALRSDLIDPTIAVHHGRVVKRTGDGALVEFRSVVDAVRCAIEVQNAMIERNAGVPEDRRIVFRIGIHLGDVVEESDGDLMGDGVNIAARLEGIAEPGAICLSEDAYRQVKGRLDLAVTDLGQTRLKNIAEPIRVYSLQVGVAAEAKPAAQPAPALALPDKPSIAVLPFQNMSGDGEQEYFCDGLVDDILTSLSKLGGLRVIARNSSFVFKGRPIDVRDAAKQLGVRYVLEGSVRKSANRIRITAQLIDARDGAHVWAERYDRAIEDIFAIQDEITLVLATETQIKLTEGEQARLRYTTTTNVQAWTLWVQGLSYYRQSISKEKVGAARLCWERALALDPTSAALDAMLGWLYCLDARFGWWEDRATAIRKSDAHIKSALQKDPDNADAYIASAGLLCFDGRFDEAVAAARKAAQLAPSSADVANLVSFYLVAAGHPEEAIAHGRRAIALNPSYPPNYLGNLGLAYRVAGQVEEAIATLNAYDARVPGSGFGLGDLVILCEQNGRFEEARQAAKRLLAARPDFTIAAWRKTQVIHDAGRLEAELAALRAAGLPFG